MFGVGVERGEVSRSPLSEMVGENGQRVSLTATMSIAPVQRRRFLSLSLSLSLVEGVLHEALACSGSNKTEDKEERTSGWDEAFCFVLCSRLFYEGEMGGRN